MISDQIPPHVRALLAFFEEELAAVRFGDVDLTALQERVEAFRGAAERESEVYATLQEARRELDRELFRLEERAERAAAYARVYARDHEALAARLDAIEAMKPGAKAKPKRRRKKAPKATPATQPPAAELPFEPPAVAS